MLFYGDYLAVGRGFFDLTYGLCGSVYMFPRNPVLGADSAFVDAGRGRGLGSTAEKNFLGSDGVGEAKQTTSVKSVKNVVENEVEGVAFDLGKFFWGGGFDAELVRFEFHH